MRTGNSSRRAKEAELQSWLDNKVIDAMNKKAGDKDRVMRARLGVDVEATGKAKASFLCLGVSRPRPDISSSGQQHTFCTGRGLDLAVSGVKYVEAGVRRHQDSILGRRRGAP